MREQPPGGSRMLRLPHPTPQHPDQPPSVPSMETPTNPSLVTAPQASPNPSEIGQRIGRYELVEILGEGGFGTVFVAEQTQPLQRRVALKVIKAGMDTKAVVARFESERQALALMDHPNIARVLDAGSTPEGRPFFAMELVRGVSITRYCEAHRLSVGNRLDLFLHVCSAIQHAHQKGIIHRDIKPSNILVADQDGAPVPKVIDFGIAKAIHGSLADRTAITQTRQVVGTPNYVSPEQVRGDGEDIDTRCDIYSLGVLLHELMCSAPPFDSKEIAGQGGDALWRAVVEQDPERPSARIRRLAREQAEAVARQRSTSPRVLAALLAGDLDWIIMRCLEKDRRLRYESAHALAEDVTRYLEHSPVHARPPSTAYRLQKAWSRHRVGLAFAAALVVALASGTVISAWQAHRADTARNEAVALARENEFVAKLLLDIFNRIDPGRIQGGAERLDQALESGLMEVASQLSPAAIRQPLILVDLKSHVGRALANLGNTRAARTQLDDALAILRREKANRHPATPSLLIALSFTHNLDGNHEKALGLLQEALELALELHGKDSPQTLAIQLRLSDAYRDLGHFDLALSLLEPVVATTRPAGPPLQRNAVVALVQIGAVHLLMGHPDAGLRFLQEAQDKLATLGDPDDRDLLAARSNLGAALTDNDRAPEAVALLEDTLRRDKRVLGPNHVDTLRCMINLSSARRACGDLPAALDLAEEALRMSRATRKDDSADVINALANVASLHLDLKRTEVAIPMLEEALRLSKATRRQDHPETLGISRILGSAILMSGDLTRAKNVLADAVARMGKALGEGSLETIDAMSELAAAHQLAGDFHEADRLQQRILALGRQGNEPNRRKTIVHLHNAALTRGNLGKWDDAVALQEECVQLHRQRFPAGHRDVLVAEATLGQFQCAAGHVAQGLALLDRVLEGQRALGEPGKAQAATTARNIAVIRLDQAIAASAWPAVAEALLAWTEARPDEFWPWCQLLAVESHLGRADAFHQRARQLAAHHASSSNTMVLAWVTKTSLLLPSPHDTERARIALASSDRIASDTTNPAWKPFGDLVRALALLRLGRPQEALPFARTAGDSGQRDSFRTAQAWAVLALCHVQLGEADAARDALNRARLLVGSPFIREPQLPSGPGPWHDVLIALTLGREAEDALAADPQPKAPVAASPPASDVQTPKQP
jgi:serine/threonine protein kinase/tetratricopeptide (TPR) repeat protein